MNTRKIGVIMLVAGAALFFIGDSLSGVGTAVDNALNSKLFAGGLALAGALLFFSTTKRVGAL